MAVTKKGNPKKKSTNPGAGLSGSTSRMTRAEEIAYGMELEGKRRIRNQKEHAALVSEVQKQIGEKKSSLNQRKKNQVSNLNTRTGQRTKSATQRKAEREIAQKRKENIKRAEANQRRVQKQGVRRGKKR